MNSEQLRLLTKMKKLVCQGKRKFENRLDRNYLDDILELGISLEEAWNHILTLNKNLYIPDQKASYLSNKNTLIFKKNINNILTYIKLKIEIVNGNEEITVCLSFHKDRKKSV